MALALAWAASFGLYKLDWLGDYQTGGWDTDAAENVAYDVASKHAFVASAKAGAVQVVDVSNPVALTHVGTLDVGANLAQYCSMTSCIYDNMDYGGWSSPCDYATMVGMIIGNLNIDGLDLATGKAYGPHGNYSMPGYVFDGGSEKSWKFSTTMKTAADCQRECQQFTGASYFSFEREYQSWMGVQINECFCKAEYTSDQIPTWLTDLDECHHYHMWEMGPTHDLHYYDSKWVGASGPTICGKFQAESVQSIATISLNGYANSIVAAASPSRYEFGTGYLTFYDAVTLNYLGCAEAGVKPEGIASTPDGGKVACLNEGSMSIDRLDCNQYYVNGSRCNEGDKYVTSHGEHLAMDHKGSMTMCDLAPSGGSIQIDCQTYYFTSDNFATAGGVSAFKTPQEYRMLDLRLYGPSGDHVTYDLEPEGGAFTADSKYFMVNFQDNNGYALFDVAAKKYVSMAGYGNISMTMDASDKDDMVDIRQGWGSSPSTPAYGLYLPDQVASFTVGGTYYFITANEGDTRDSKDLIGEAGDFEGEEIRMKDLPATCGNACADGKAGDMGRILTTPFMPSDYSANACGTQLCEAWALDRASKSDFDCIYYQADYGGKKDALGNTAHPECGYADTLVYVIDKMNKADGSTYGTRPTSGGFFPNAETRGEQTVKPWYNYSIPGWFISSGGASEEDPAVTGPRECQMKCAAHAAANPSNGCDHFSYEFEHGYHECLLKKAHSTTHCHLYSPWIQHWADGGDQYWEGYSGPATCPEGSATATGKAPYTTERFTTNPGDGAPGGATAIGTRSFTIFSWSGNAGDRLVQVYDSGSDFETKQAEVNHGLCSACKGVAGTDCDKTCPFNSDEAPPKLDDRSDAKGPEPECVTTGVMADGTLLAFIGLERTGGVMVYDISNPAAATFQDFLNVRNWRVGETPDNDEVAKNLNDGPESMVFVSAADSPIGKELLLVATPLAGRLTAYAISSASTARGNDGSCKDTPTCPYISAANGGSGVIRDFMDICNWCSTCTDAQKEAFGCSSRYSFEVVAAGTLEDFAGTAGAEKIDAIKTSVAAAAGAGVSKADVTVTVTAGSVIIKISIKADSAGELVEISNKVDPLLQTAGNATSLLGGQVTVESVSYKPPTEASPPPAPAMPPLKSDDGIPMWGLIVIIVFGAAFVFVCLVLMVVVRKEKKGKPIFVPMEKVHPGNTKG